jgi:hypothetical protein
MIFPSDEEIEEHKVEIHPDEIPENATSEEIRKIAEEKRDADD